MATHYFEPFRPDLIMPKIIYTDRDIEDHARQGLKSLTIDENTVITDLAYEKASQLGITLVYSSPENPPAAPLRPYLSHEAPFRQAAPALNLTNISPLKDRKILLRFSKESSESDLRAAILETGNIAYRSGLMISNDGNISARMSNGHILVTPSGVCKGRINAEDLLIVDIDGNLLKPAADPALKPTSEQPMHLEVYRQRPDVRAVIHTHLVYANALVIAKGKVRMDVMPEAAIAFDSIPITDYAMPSSTQNAQAIRDLIPNHNVILIRNHGSLTVGKDLDEALIHLERLEHISKTLTFAELLGDVTPLPPELLEAIARTIQRSKTGKF